MLTHAMAVETPCEAHCGRMRPGDAYLCPACWNCLPGDVKAKLHEPGGQRLRRYAQLLAQLDAHVPLDQVTLS